MSWKDTTKDLSERLDQIVNTPDTYHLTQEDHAVIDLASQVVLDMAADRDVNHAWKTTTEQYWPHLT